MYVCEELAQDANQYYAMVVSIVRQLTCFDIIVASPKFASMFALGLFSFHFFVGVSSVYS